MKIERNVAIKASTSNLANVIQLAKSLVKATQGNDIGTTLNGEDTISDDALTMYVSTSLQNTLRGSQT